MLSFTYHGAISLLKRSSSETKSGHFECTIRREKIVLHSVMRRTSINSLLSFVLRNQDRALSLHHLQTRFHSLEILELNLELHSSALKSFFTSG